MKPYTMYVCEICGFEHKSGEEMLKHEANHLGLSESELEKYISLQSFARYMGSVVSNTNNNTTRKIFDKAIEDLLSFEKEHNIQKMEVLNKVSKLRAFKSAHKTTHVVLQNCTLNVSSFLSNFDIWNSTGRFVYNNDKPNEAPEIWYECPIEFLDFIESSMGTTAFTRMGVKEFYIEH